MVEATQTLNVAIVGGGPGCKAIMDMIFAKRLSQLRMQLVGVACTNPQAVGYLYAQAKGFYTTKDFRDLYRLKDLDMIIELTGQRHVADEIYRTKPDHVGVMDHKAARLFWDVFEIQEDRIAEQKRSEDALRAARDHLERQVKERTRRLSRSNKVLKAEIKERKRAEHALREGEERLQTILDHLQVGILIIDAESRQVVDVNQVAAQMIGLTKHQIVGQLCHKLVCPEHQDGCPITDFGQRLHAETAILQADGKQVPILKTVFPVFLDGRKHLLESFLDITPQKEVEARLQDKNRELENFVHVVSHELKTPIIAVLGFSSRLAKHCRERLDEEAKRYLEQIQASGKRMEAFVSDLLSLARVGSVAFVFRDVSSSNIVRNVVARLEPRLKKARVKLKVANNLPTIHADEERISQVFENLLVNAIKFGGHAKKPEVEVGYKKEKDGHLFYVRDNGIGIDPANHGKIFEMFLRLGEIDDKEGTGIGLPIVESIVKNHGGEVRVESEKGRGATFYFTLPKSPRPR
jgi:PAS domain S-box-containing protein